LLASLGVIWYNLDKGTLRGGHIVFWVVVVGVICFVVNPALGVAYVLLIVFLPVLKIISDNKKKKRIAQLRIDALDYGINFDGAMTGADFEQAFAELMRRYGAGEVIVTKQSGDYGVDVVVNGSEGRSVFQCKWSSGSVGVKAVQEVCAGKIHYRADHAYVVTNSRFTKNAETLAETTGVQLWDGGVLLYLVEKVKSTEREQTKESEVKVAKRKHNND
jgi:HJR/Mrr/RecB family endonuclease